MTKKNSANSEELKLDIVGSSNFGRNPKIMASRTFNMIIADDFLVELYGYSKIIDFSNSYKGRGTFGSVKGNIFIFVTGNQVYSITIYRNPVTGKKQYSKTIVGTIDTYSGSVFIDENNVGQIGICDQHDVWIYTYSTGAFVKATLPAGFKPGYITYQNGRFVVPDTLTSVWALSAAGNGLNWFWGASGEPVLGAIQSKPDNAVATLRFPGRGNLLLVFGKTVTELWVDVGASGFPYQKTSSVNIDYGVVNSATIAASTNIVCWLGANEKSGPVIMYSTGSDIQKISTDGINFKIDNLINPEMSSAFFFKRNGHLIYQLTFYDPRDNFTIIYDFTTQKFFDATDENMDFHIANQLSFFDNSYYFASLRDGSLYELNDGQYYYDYGKFKDGSPKIFEIPRVRVCSNIRAENSSRFAINNCTFILEQGNDELNTGNNSNYIPRIARSLSKDGGISFGQYIDRPVYKVGNRINRLNWWGGGVANDLVPQFRFYGQGPWRCTSGIVSVYQ
jgi:hypothetical protein